MVIGYEINQNTRKEPLCEALMHASRLLKLPLFFSSLANKARRIVRLSKNAEECSMLQ